MSRSRLLSNIDIPIGCAYENIDGILYDPISIAIIGAAAIGAGASVYTANQQEDIAKKEQERLAKEESARKAEADRIARETRPTGETAKGVQFGTTQSKPMGSTQDFLIPKGGASGLGVTGKSGLGFSV